MQRADLAQEDHLGAADVLDGLAGLGLREEGHEIDRVAGAQRHADLALLLEAADAGAVAGARIDHHEGLLRRVERLIRLGPYAHQGIVDRPLELATVDDHVPGEREDRRMACLVMLDRLVAAFAQHVPEQHRALRGVDPVVPDLAGRSRRQSGRERGGRRRRLRHLLAGSAPGLRDRLGQPLRRRLGQPGERCSLSARAHDAPCRPNLDIRGICCAAA